MSDRGAQTSADAAVAGVIARPPVLFLGALLLGVIADRLGSLPVPPAPGWLRWGASGSLALAGLGLFVAGIGNFTVAATPVPTNQPTRALVTDGVHGWTRNPIYLGMFFVYVAIGIAVGSAWTLVLTVPLALTIRHGVVGREEAYLERRFGGEYRSYRARVPRWLGRPVGRTDRPQAGSGQDAT